MRYQRFSLPFIFSRALLVTSKCEDSNENFEIWNGNTKSCTHAVNNRNWCSQPVFMEMCPLSCDQCLTDKPLPPPVDCVDNTEIFLIKNGKEKSCKDAQRNAKKWCSRGVFKDNCKASCNTCLQEVDVISVENGSDCSDEDWDVKYELENGSSKKSCENASLNTDLCRHKEIRDKCRRTCGQCDFPSVSPSFMPTLAPSTQFPSTSPSTQFPSTSPSTQIPSQTPSTKQDNCIIDANLRYPKVNQNGYHSDMMSVVKVGETDVCSYNYPSTPWCQHTGDAEVWNPKNGAGYKKEADIFIDDAAGSTFEFLIHHFFTEYEQYYDKDHLLQSVFTVTAGFGSSKATNWFKSGSKENVDTHLNNVKHLEDINLDYDSVYSVTVTCNSKCDCNIERSKPICDLHAEIEFPMSSPAGAGFHETVMSVTKQNESDSCSYENVESYWGCYHNGARAYRDRYDYNDYYYVDHGKEMVDIRDAADSTFDFLVSHRFNKRELDYEGDHTKSGELHLFANGKEFTEVDKGLTYPTFKGIDSYVNGKPNPDYKGNFLTSVSCDSKCNCQYEYKPLQCKIRAKLVYPEDEVQYYGYSSQEFSIMKSGYDQLCGRDSPPSDWGCFHDGTAKVEKLDPKYYSVFESEEATIYDGADGIFEFKVSHVFSPYENWFGEDGVKMYYDDHKIQAFFQIYVNDIQQQEYVNPKNVNQDTHNTDGSINWKFRGEYTIKTECDTECNCSFEKINEW